MPLQKHSLTIAGHRTSITLEPEFWTELNKIADSTRMSVPDLVARIDANRGDNNLSSAIRVYILAWILANNRSES